VIVPVLAGIALRTAFVLHALRAEDPLIDLRLFRDRTFTTSSVMLVLVLVVPGPLPGKSAESGWTGVLATSRGRRPGTRPRRRRP
jgi:hypothetical protein